MLTPNTGLLTPQSAIAPQFLFQSVWSISFENVFFIFVFPFPEFATSRSGMFTFSVFLKSVENSVAEVLYTPSRIDFEFEKILLFESLLVYAFILSTENTLISDG